MNNDRSNSLLSGKLSKQLIQDLGCSIALNKGFSLALNYEIRLLKLNNSKHIKVYCFRFKINDLSHQFTYWSLLKLQWRFTDL